MSKLESMSLYCGLKLVASTFDVPREAGTTKFGTRSENGKFSVVAVKVDVVVEKQRWIAVLNRYLLRVGFVDTALAYL